MPDVEGIEEGEKEEDNEDEEFDEPLTNDQGTGTSEFVLQENDMVEAKVGSHDKLEVEVDNDKVEEKTNDPIAEENENEKDQEKELANKGGAAWVGEDQYSRQSRSNSKSNLKASSQKSLRSNNGSRASLRQAPDGGEDANKGSRLSLKSNVSKRSQKSRAESKISVKSANNDVHSPSRAATRASEVDPDVQEEEGKDNHLNDGDDNNDVISPAVSMARSSKGMEALREASSQVRENGNETGNELSNIIIKYTVHYKIVLTLKCCRNSPK